MPSKRILRHQKFLEYYAEADQKRQKSLLKSASKDQVNCICEIALNVVNKNIPVHSATKHALCNHKIALCTIADKSASFAKRKKILVQKGGAFLPLILSTVLPLIAQAIFNK